jgi:hypothetical protein
MNDDRTRNSVARTLQGNLLLEPVFFLYIARIESEYKGSDHFYFGYARVNLVELYSVYAWIVAFVPLSRWERAGVRVFKKVQTVAAHSIGIESACSETL